MTTCSHFPRSQSIVRTILSSWPVVRPRLVESRERSQYTNISTVALSSSSIGHLSWPYTASL